MGIALKVTVPLKNEKQRSLALEEVAELACYLSWSLVLLEAWPPFSTLCV